MMYSLLGAIRIGSSGDPLPSYDVLNTEIINIWQSGDLGASGRYSYIVVGR